MNHRTIMDAMTEPNAPATASGGGLARFFPFIVIACALTVRIGYLGEISQSPNYDIKYHQGTDQYDYFVDALKIYDGDLVGSGLFNRSPLYPYFLALTFALTGGGNLLLPRLVQGLLGALLAWLVYRLGARAGGRVAGLAAGLIFAAYGPMLVYEMIFLRDALLGLLFLGVVMLMIRTRERPTARNAFLTGVVFLLSYLAKPNIMVMVPVLGWWVWRIRRDSCGSGLPAATPNSLSGPEGPSHTERPSHTGGPSHTISPALKVCAAFILGLAVAFAPLFIRNLAAGVPAFSTTQRGALEFIAGNHPAVSTLGWNVPAEVSQLDRDCNQRMGCAVVEVLRLYRDRPWDLVAKQWDKLLLFGNGYELPSNLSYYVERRYVPFLALPWVNWSILIALALPGMWLARRKWAELFELYAFVILLSIGTLAFYIVDRFRLPLVPALAVFAGVTVEAVVTGLRGKRYRTAAVMLAVAFAIAALSWPRPRDPFNTNDYHNLIRYHLMKGKPDQAAELYREGMEKAVAQVAEYGDAQAQYRFAYLLYLGGEPLPTVLAEMEKARNLSPEPEFAKQLDLAVHYIRSRLTGPDPKVGGYRLD